MLAKELLLVTGLVVSGAVSLPLSVTAEAPAILERDLSSDINAIALKARAPVRGKKDPASVPQSQWANPFLPQVVNKPKPKMPDMEAGWSKPREPTSKEGSGKPPKVPKKNGKRDVEEEAEAAEYSQ